MEIAKKGCILILCIVFTGCGAVKTATVPPEQEIAEVKPEKQPEPPKEEPEKKPEPEPEPKEELKEPEPQPEPAPEQKKIETVLKKITFQSGLSIEGIIVKKGSGKITIRTEIGTYSFPAKQVKLIEDAGLPGTIDESINASDKNGLEAGSKLTLQKWGNSGSIKRELEPDGNVRVRFAAKEGDKDKAALQIEMKMNLENKKKLVFDVFNPYTEPVKIAAALATGTEWTYYESKLIEIKDGWTKAVIDLTSADFKSQATEWKYGAKVENMSQTTHIFLLIYNGKKEIELIFDNIGFE